MYTHDFKIEVNGIDLTGEINFNSGEMPKVKFNAGFEIPLKEFGEVKNFLYRLQDLYFACGEITEIAIDKKP